MTGPLGYQYAGFGRRLAAYLVDVLIGLLGLLLTGMLIRAILAAGTFQQPAGMTGTWDRLGMQGKLAVVIAYFVSLGALYFPLCHASPAQATVGKRIANIYLVAQDGSRLSFARAFGRWFVQVVLAPFGIGLISVVTILTDPKRRAVHDFVVGSVVTLGIPPGRPPLEWWRVAVAIGVQVVWLVITFSFTLGFV